MPVIFPLRRVRRTPFTAGNEAAGAARLMALISPRDLGRMQVGQCWYLPVCEASGGMLNDPVAVKLAEDRF